MLSRARLRPEPKAAQNGDSEAQKDLARPSAEDIYKQVATNARQELARSSFSLALSGIGGGTFMGLSALGPAMSIATLGYSATAHVISFLFYPLGFIVVMLGRSQLFTENTLYPVALVLAERREFWNTMRLWAIVLPANVAGAFCFALITSYSSAVDHGTVQVLAKLGVDALAHPPSTIFWSGVMGGWMIALAAWLVSGSHSITGSVMVIWMLTFVVGFGGFAHCIASSCEIMVSVLTGHAAWSAYGVWLLFAVLGNVCGGVGLVTILEYGQVVDSRKLKLTVRS